MDKPMSEVNELRVVIDTLLGFMIEGYPVPNRPLPDRMNCETHMETITGKTCFVIRHPGLGVLGIVRDDRETHQRYTIFYAPSPIEPAFLAITDGLLPGGVTVRFCRVANTRYLTRHAETIFGQPRNSTLNDSMLAGAWSDITMSRSNLSTVTREVYRSDFGSARVSSASGTSLSETSFSEIVDDEVGSLPF